MPLNNAQIERYSRQIIVPRFGGAAQERLLASHLLLAGEADDIAEPLAYLAGAGVGSVHLLVAGDPARAQQMSADMHALNPDCAVVPSPSRADRIDLAIALVGSARVLDQVRAGDVFTGSCIAARLDSPHRIAILPSSPPCIRCADADILGAFNSSGSELDAFVAMLATAEALKIAARYEPSVGPALIELRGYSTATRPLLPRPSGCSCRDR